MWTVNVQTEHIQNNIFGNNNIITIIDALIIPNVCALYTILLLTKHEAKRGEKKLDIEMGYQHYVYVFHSSVY